MREPSRGGARCYALAMTALLGWGAWQGVSALREPATRARIAATLTLEGFLGGHTAAAVNHAMAHGLPADPALRAAGGVLRWGLFRSGGPAVRVGCDGWLFLAEELRPWPDAAAAMAERAAALGRLRAKLAGEEVALLVAVVPDKARLEAAQLCGAPRAAEAVARLPDWLGLLRAQGVRRSRCSSPCRPRRRPSGAPTRIGTSRVPPPPRRRSPAPPPPCRSPAPRPSAPRPHRRKRTAPATCCG